MVYEYTKARAPIAAMYSSPGPSYGLPSLTGDKIHDPRSVHHKYPAYSFGVRHGKFKDDCSPGPCYYPNPKVYRSGQDGTPHYSLYSRQVGTSSFQTPGPGAYSPEHVGPTAHHRHPAYSFGTRHRHRKTDNIPAANRYTLPGMIGSTVQSGKPQAPCYTLRSRQNVGNFAEDLARAPGPGTYNTTDPSIYKDKAPLYSMTSRNMMPGDTTQKPGPGAHKPETEPLQKTAPSFPFGLRHSQYTCMVMSHVDDLGCPSDLPPCPKRIVC